MNKSENILLFIRVFIFLSWKLVQWKWDKLVHDFTCGSYCRHGKCMKCFVLKGLIQTNIEKWKPGIGFRGEIFHRHSDARRLIMSIRNQRTTYILMEMMEMTADNEKARKKEGLLLILSSPDSRFSSLLVLVLLSPPFRALLLLTTCNTRSFVSAFRSPCSRTNDKRYPTFSVFSLFLHLLRLLSWTLSPLTSKLWFDARDRQSDPQFRPEPLVTRSQAFTTHNMRTRKKRETQPLADPHTSWKSDSALPSLETREEPLLMNCFLGGRNFFFVHLFCREKFEKGKERKRAFAFNCILDVCFVWMCLCGYQLWKSVSHTRWRLTRNVHTIPAADRLQFHGSLLSWFSSTPSSFYNLLWSRLISEATQRSRAWGGEGVKSGTRILVCSFYQTDWLPNLVLMPKLTWLSSWTSLFLFSLLLLLFTCYCERILLSFLMYLHPDRGITVSRTFFLRHPDNCESIRHHHRHDLPLSWIKHTLTHFIRWGFSVRCFTVSQLPSARRSLSRSFSYQILSRLFPFSQFSAHPVTYPFLSQMSASEEREKSVWEKQEKWLKKETIKGNDDDDAWDAGSYFLLLLLLVPPSASTSESEVSGSGSELRSEQEREGSKKRMQDWGWRRIACESWKKRWDERDRNERRRHEIWEDVEWRVKMKQEAKKHVHLTTTWNVSPSSRFLPLFMWEIILFCKKMRRWWRNMMKRREASWWREEEEAGRRVRTSFISFPYSSLTPSCMPVGEFFVFWGRELILVQKEQRFRRTRIGGMRGDSNWRLKVLRK